MHRPPAIKMAEGLPVDRYSPNTLEKIVDGVLELERGQERLLELEEEVLGVAVKEHVPQNEGEMHLAQGEEEDLAVWKAFPIARRISGIRFHVFCVPVFWRDPISLILGAMLLSLSVDRTVV